MMPSTTPPRTPFSTPLSGSAKEARLRLLHILQGPKKGPPAPLAALLVAAALLCVGLVSCQTEEAPPPDDTPVPTAQGAEAQAVLAALAPYAQGVDDAGGLRGELLAVLGDGPSLAAAWFYDYYPHYALVIAALDENGAVAGEPYVVTGTKGRPWVQVLSDSQGETLVYTANSSGQELSWGEAGAVTLEGTDLTWTWPVEGDIHQYPSPDEYTEYHRFWHGRKALLTPGGVELFSAGPEFYHDGGYEPDQWQDPERVLLGSAPGDDLPAEVWAGVRAWLEALQAPDEAPYDTALWQIVSLVPGDGRDAYELEARTDDGSATVSAALTLDGGTVTEADWDLRPAPTDPADQEPAADGVTPDERAALLEALAAEYTMVWEEGDAPYLLLCQPWGDDLLIGAARHTGRFGDTLLIGVMDRDSGRLTGPALQRSWQGGRPQVLFYQEGGTPYLAYVCDGSHQGYSGGDAGLLRFQGDDFTWVWPVEGDLRDEDSQAYQDYRAFWDVTNHFPLLAPGGFEVFIPHPAGGRPVGPEWASTGRVSLWADPVDELPGGTYDGVRAWLENFARNDYERDGDWKESYFLWQILSLAPLEGDYGQEAGQVACRLEAKPPFQYPDDPDRYTLTAELLVDGETGQVVRALKVTADTAGQIQQWQDLGAAPADALPLAVEESVDTDVSPFLSDPWEELLPEQREQLTALTIDDLPSEVTYPFGELDELENPSLLLLAQDEAADVALYGAVTWADWPQQPVAAAAGGIRTAGLLLRAGERMVWLPVNWSADAWDGGAPSLWTGDYDGDGRLEAAVSAQYEHGANFTPHSLVIVELDTLTYSTPDLSLSGQITASYADGVLSVTAQGETYTADLTQATGGDPADMLANNGYRLTYGNRTSFNGWYDTLSFFALLHAAPMVTPVGFTASVVWEDGAYRLGEVYLLSQSGAEFALGH